MPPALPGDSLPKDVLHSIEKRLALGLLSDLGLGWAQRVGQLLDGLPLLARQLGRHLDAERHEEIAEAATAHVGQAFARHAESAARLRAFGDGQRLVCRSGSAR